MSQSQQPARPAPWATSCRNPWAASSRNARATSSESAITLQDAADYMLRMSEIRQNMSGWQYVAKLMLDTASGEDIGCQVSLALMLDGQMVFE